jgi:hypothetical protein
MFVAAGDQLEEQVGGVLLEGDVADFVDLSRCRHRSTYADPVTMPRLAAGLMVCLWPCRSGLCVLDVVGIFTVLRGRLGVDRVAGICPVLLLPG